ncbi:hypothetical protein M431DRAFT_504554 [Trichoderma harzianum CBS 226.95]|uniref:Uncharacterized protein n=1 Tax=Trichoderma harzianum CBS 226.95 TaxID=983964 RepID=A0A2T4ARB8_TRIHA|nr:hypothetical protein M431DRAFT_504554 [Trichoderma harzianum CBS 226.95]PTB59593.1 hypothetical protein M431DRAFT_504554 [Trichoderma harzianum CBS 226.95]
MPSSSAGTASIRGWVPCCIFLANHQALRHPTCSTSTARIAHLANLSMESLKVLILVHSCSRSLVEHEEPCRHSQP